MKIGILEIAAAVLVTLKLTGVISIGWLWALAPLWAPFALVFVALLFPQGRAILRTHIRNKAIIRGLTRTR